MCNCGISISEKSENEPEAENKETEAQDENIPEGDSPGEKLLDINLPAVSQLPSENLAYDSLADEVLKQVTEDLTSLVFTHVLRLVKCFR